jgi:quercetin dioxygenase-like cupin family protein
MPSVVARSEGIMRQLLIAVVASLGATSPFAQELAKPDLLVQEIVQGMPKSDKQEVRVLTATIQPGGKTPFHTHRFPVTVYILEGTFTLELEGRPTRSAKSGRVLHRAPERQNDRLQQEPK